HARRAHRRPGSGRTHASLVGRDACRRRGRGRVTDTGDLFGVVASGSGGVWRVIEENGSIHEVSLRGRLKKSDAGRRPDASIRRDTVATNRGKLKLAVGDRVRLGRDDRGGTWAIDGILPRTSRLARRAPGGAHGERIIAA